MNTKNRNIVVRTLAWIIPVAVLTQAAITGGTLFAGLDLTQVHGDIGMVVLLAAAALTVVAWLQPWGRWLPALTGTMTGALVAQIGLGFTGHRTGTAWASAVHVPLGTLIVGLSVAIAVLISLNHGQKQKSTDQENI